MSEPTDIRSHKPPKPSMQFAVGEKVRVVSAATPWWWWEGEVTAAFNGDLMTGVKQYQVRFIVNGVIRLPPLLFTEIELAYAGD